MNQKIELNLHTKMGNGIIEPKLIVEEMRKRGYQTFAVTDENSVQAFPIIDASVQVYNETHEDKMKVIYGAELNVIDTHKPISFNDTFIVLDIETTGLSDDDEIIMVVAQKWEKGKIVDKRKQLIKPKKLFTERVEAITKITNEMLEKEKTVEFVIHDLKAFLSDFPLVVINTPYIRKYFNKILLENKLETLTNPIYDIVKLAKEKCLDLKQFHLQALATYFHISIPKKMTLENRIVMISQIFQKLGLETKENTPFKMTVLVRNRQGLKHLYELITLSHTSYPKGLPFEVIVEKSDGLLLGVNADDGEIERHFDDFSEHELEERMLCYDYIEVLPPSYTKTFFANEKREQIKRLMNLAFQYRKMVVATSHACSFEKGDDICFEILNKKETCFPFLNKEELKKEFSFLTEKMVYDIVINNPNKISTLCEEIKILEEKMHLPEIENSDNKLVQKVYFKAHLLYGNDLPEEVNQRIATELYGPPILKSKHLESTILLGRKELLQKFPECIGKGILGSFHEAMFLIPKMLIESSETFYESRGALGSSFVAFLLEMTEVNPLMPHYRCSNCKHIEFQKNVSSGFDLEDKICPKCGLLMKKDGHCIPYASLLGHDASLLPDININFEDTMVEELRNKAVQVFGEEQVFYPGVIGRCSEHNAYLKVEQFSYQMEKDLEEEKINIAHKIAQTKERMGIAPSEILIVPKNHTINEFTPIEKIYGKKITHFDYHELKEVLPKFNLLGHTDLTLLHHISDLASSNIMDISFDDQQVFELLKSAKTLKLNQKLNIEIGTFGVPDFSIWNGMENLQKLNIFPKNFSECVKLLGLSHGTGVFEGNGLELLKQGIPFSQLITHREDIMNLLLEHSVSYEEAYQIMEFIGKGKHHNDKEKWKVMKTRLQEIGIEDWYIKSCEKIIYLFPKAHHVSYMLRFYRFLYAKIYEANAFYNAYFKLHADYFKQNWNHIDELKREWMEGKELKTETLVLLLEAKVRNIKINH